MLVKTKQDMVYRNSLKRAGEVFEYEGSVPPACCEAVIKDEPRPVSVTNKRSSSKKVDD